MWALSLAGASSKCTSPPPARRWVGRVLLLSWGHSAVLFDETARDEERTRESYEALLQRRRLLLVRGMWGMQSRVALVRRDEPSLDVQLSFRQGCVGGSIQFPRAGCCLVLLASGPGFISLCQQHAVVHGMQRYA